MRKFTIPARRFSSMVLPFTSPFIQAPAAVPQRGADAAATRSKRPAETGHTMSARGYAEAAVRLSRTYW
ncbi:hypothetical protein [uncultured Ralstonia sp.]|jgi:hypothetical protein|uniref:hypothetical protein n=1 Tax=Ralstonia sp. TaxID=54061 RepID=UPI001EA664A4|nr:hypothetical protein [uncultured Ralstonia sp.]UCF22946.1 MAG: hypothetical protein JSV72_19035 [Ralstonia sp.]